MDQRSISIFTWNDQIAREKHQKYSVRHKQGQILGGEDFRSTDESEGKKWTNGIISS